MSRVDVYRNLTRRCWSVRQAGRLVAHRDAVTLMDVRFHVSEAGRQRVIRLGQRSVMAHARGTICEARLWPSAVQIRFCPFSGPAFVDEEGAPVATAHLVHFSADGAAWGILS